ncbi:hypothetical protein [Streptomyces sp. KL116D]|uniref:hypothetical protein n=1 Tax=Streptomyces sp. KL116D TaxID=3045152 RepID=UPI0035579684
MTSTTPPATALDASSAQTTTTDLDPVRGQVVKQTDTNSKATQTAYDALGRISKVWLADRNTSQTNYEYTYTITGSAPRPSPPRRSTNNGGQTTSYALYDGSPAGPSQLQSPGPDGGT